MSKNKPRIKSLNEIQPHINYKAIKPKVSHYYYNNNNKRYLYTWEINTTKPQVHIYFTVDKNSKRFMLYRGHVPKTILSIEYVWSEHGRYSEISFAKKVTPQKINYIKTETDGTIKIVRSGNFESTKDNLYYLIFKPDGTTEVAWHKKMVSDGEVSYGDYPKTVYDKQGNLLHFVKVLTPKSSYELKLTSPGSYKVHIKNEKRIKQWASLIAGSGISEIIHI